MVKYFLMHKDTVCGTISFDETTGRIAGYKDHHTGFSPYMGQADVQKIKKWWEMRSVPASRNMIREVIKKSGCLNAEMYLAKNLALSMIDTYWVCPADANLKYDQVKFSNLSVYNEGKVPYHNATSYDYNASLGGQMEKYWDLDQPTAVLVKESSKYYGQQSVNEVLATQIHTRQNNEIPFVKYSAEIVEGHGIISRCQAFTSDTIELISAYELMESQKPQNSRALYDHYIDLCAQYGIDRDCIQKFMDYQTMTDFIISNTDEHLLNFGVLRDPDTMRLIGPAPIFDSGNSMFFSDDRTAPYSRVGLLERKITSFYDTEDKMLAKVKNRNVVKLDLLPPPDEIRSLYMQAGIPEQKAEFISQNYEKKMQMLYEFQQGKTISLYQERNAEKQKLREEEKDVHSSQKLIVLCGVPGSGKTAKAAELAQVQQQKGRRFISADVLYTISDAIRASAFVLDRKQVMKELKNHSGYEKTVTVISANSIRKEIEEQGLTSDNNMVFLIAQARTKAALISGATVIYDASNLSERARRDFLEIAKDAGVKSTELYIMNIENAKPEYEISPERMDMLKQRIIEHYPSMEEGWSEIVDENSDLVKTQVHAEHEDDSENHQELVVTINW